MASKNRQPLSYTLEMEDCIFDIRISKCLLDSTFELIENLKLMSESEENLKIFNRAMFMLKTFEEKFDESFGKLGELNEELRGVLISSDRR